MVLRRDESTSFWSSLRRGPWPERVVERLERALRRIEEQLAARNEIVGIVVFGSYARGEFGKTSDVDLLILFEGYQHPETTTAGSAALRVVGEIEAAERLPMHIAPLLASVDLPHELGPDLLHDIWADGVVLYAKAGALARLQPKGLAPYVLVRFSLRGAPDKEKVRLSRRLHGSKGKGGILGPQAITLGRGVVLVPANQQAILREVLDEAGATYDMIQVWREV
ncbi:MAG: nucleotidyltransferase domain-containing protein [Candidatus Bilamarchaeaceae archaeon]